MKALVFHKIGDISVDNVPDPVIEQPDDIILRVTSTAICGSDLHIYNGFVPQLRDEVLGHEFMGIVEEAGGAVIKAQLIEQTAKNGSTVNGVRQPKMLTILIVTSILLIIKTNFYGKRII